MDGPDQVEAAEDRGNFGQSNDNGGELGIVVVKEGIPILWAWWVIEPSIANWGNFAQRIEDGMLHLGEEVWMWVRGRVKVAGGGDFD